MANTFLLYKDINGNVSYKLPTEMGLPALKSEEGALGYETSLTGGIEITITVPSNCYLAFIKYNADIVRFKVGTTPLPIVSVGSFSLTQVEVSPFIREVEPGDILRFYAEVGSPVSLISVSFWGKNINNSIPIPIVPPQLLLYVIDRSGNSVKIINTETNTLINTISVEMTPVFGITNSNFSKEYVANEASSNISIIDPVTQVVISNISLDSGPTKMAYSSMTNLLYALTNTNEISLINSSNDTFLKKLPTGNGGAQVLLNPLETRVFVRNQGSNTIMSFSNENDFVLKSTTPVGSSPLDMVFGINGSALYVVNDSDRTLSILNTSSDNVSVVKTIPTLSLSPQIMAITPNYSKIYIGNNGNTLDIFDVILESFIGSALINVNTPVYLLIDSSGKFLYGISSSDEAVGVYNLQTNMFEKVINVGVNPVFGIFSNDEEKLYVMNSTDSEISVISTQTLTVINTIFVGGEPIFGNLIN